MVYNLNKKAVLIVYDDFSISEIEFELMMREMKKWNHEDVEQVIGRALSQCEEIKEQYPTI